MKDTSNFVLIWCPDDIPLCAQVIITNKNKTKRNVPDGSWIGINKRGLAKSSPDVIVGK